VQAATLSGGFLSFMAFTKFNQQWISQTVKFGSKDVIKFFMKDSHMARHASLM
jgi:hypothetical protein